MGAGRCEITRLNRQHLTLLVVTAPVFTELECRGRQQSSDKPAKRDKVSSRRQVRRFLGLLLWSLQLTVVGSGLVGCRVQNQKIADCNGLTIFNWP